MYIDRDLRNAEPTCVEPRHVDATWGEGGVRCQTFFFPFSADYELDWQPSKVVFFGWATNALNARNIFLAY